MTCCKRTERQIHAAYKAAQSRKRKVSTCHNGTVLTFSSLKEASEKLSIPSSAICNSCRYGVKVKRCYNFNYV